MFPKIEVLPYFLHGHRFPPVIHARLRNKCSDLNDDLFHKHVSDHNICTNYLVPETTKHYFFHCNKYALERDRLFQSMQQLHPLNCHLLLFSNHTKAKNITIVNSVHKYILDSKRFKQ